MIAADGEGATKLLECTVTGAATTDIAKTVAKSVTYYDTYLARLVQFILHLLPLSYE